MTDLQTLHESVVTDILDTMRDGLRVLDDMKPSSNSIERASSISKATSGLTMVFPTLVSKNCSIEDATMVSKALERKNIALLQMAFSAYNITDCKDAISHLQKFHTNMGKKVDLDSFMDAMEALGENTRIKYPNVVRSITEDCKRNINFTFKDDINPVSLLVYKEATRYGTTMVIKEAPLKPTGNPHRNKQDAQDLEGSLQNTQITKNDNNKRWVADYDQEERHHAQDRADKFDASLQKATKDKSAQLTQMLLPSEVKKANELQPSLMIVNFYVNDRDRDLNIGQQIVAGVKSKIYAVDSDDIIYKLISTHVDGDLMLKLVKVSTREISFVRDFLLGIDDAKLDSINSSKRSSSAMFKALEKRALKGKIRKTLRMNNSAKAIASLVITMEEVEELKKTQNIDVTVPRVILPIMEKLCLLNFVIVDTTSESIMIIEDGATEYEHISFSGLEKDNGDSSYKKVVNLMTKVAR